MYQPVGAQDLPLDLAARKIVGTKDDPIAAFGQRISETIMDKIWAVPPDDRAPVLMATLDAINPQLYGVVDEKAKRYMAEKGYSARVALKHALAAAFANDLLSDFIRAGKTRNLSLSGSLALGCYGGRAQARALGRYAQALGVITSGVRDHRGQDQPGVPIGTVPPTQGKIRTLQVGPFMFYDDVTWDRSTAYHGTRRLPASWQTFFRNEETRLGFVVPFGTVAASSIGVDKWLGWPASKRVMPNYFNGSVPIIKFTHPKTGVKFGVYLEATTEKFSAVMKKVPTSKSWYKRLWGALKSLPGKILDFAVDVIEKVGDMACKVVSNPAGQIAAAGGAVAAGAPPDAAVMGTQIAAGLCASNPTPTPDTGPLMRKGLPFWAIPVAALVGVGVLTVALKKKRR
jgi:hypothetical protein